MADDLQRQLDHDRIMRIKSSQERFDYSFATLCFAALALSLQFSERESALLNPVLVAAWACYLTAALLSAWRLMSAPQFDKISHARDRLDRFIVERRNLLERPDFQAAAAADSIQDVDTGEPLSIKEMQAPLREEEEKRRQANTNLDELQGKLVTRFNLSVAFLLAALVLNGVYLSVNLLARG